MTTSFVDTTFVYADPADVRDIVRNSHGMGVAVEAWLGNSPVLGPDLKPLMLQVVSGEVTIDHGSQVRRVLSMSTPASDGLWDRLTPGVELKVRYGLYSTRGPVQWVQLGVFGIDEASISYVPGGVINITAPDRWAKVQRALFERVRQTSGNAVASIIELVNEAVPGAADTVVNTTGSRWHAPRSRWTEDRNDAVTRLAKAASVDVCFDPFGRLSIRPAPVLATRQPSWRVDAGLNGIQLTADRTLSRQRTYNVVIVRPENSDGLLPFALVSVEDRDPTSPTYASGPFGRSVKYYSDPLIVTRHQAFVAAYVLLDRWRSLAAQLTLTATCNPQLDVGDVIGVILPRAAGVGNSAGRKRIERHLVESCTIPLTPDGVQTIATRSSRPDDEDDGGLLIESWVTWNDYLDNYPNWTSVLNTHASWATFTTDTRKTET